MSEAAATRRGRPGYDQATVLRRAIELFNTQGYDATSMGDLARELGLTKSAIYHHVPSKEALLSAALDEALDGLEVALDGAEDLCGALEAAVHVLVEHLPAVTLLLRVRGNSAVELAALRRRRALDERLAVLVRSGVADGSVRADLDADVIGRLLFGAVNSLVEWYRPGGPLDATALAGSVTALVFDGLRRPTSPDGHDRPGAAPMDVTRLVTLVELDDMVIELREMAVSARHEAVLANGDHVLLLDDRGWSASGPPDVGAATSLEEVVATARTVVGPDEPFGGRSHDDMAADHWAHLADVLGRQGVHAEAQELGRLPHDVVLGGGLLERINGAGDAVTP